MKLQSTSRMISIPLRKDGAVQNDFDQLSELLIFAAPNVRSVNMQVKIHNMYFTNTRPVDNILHGAGDEILSANKWNVGGVYSIAKDDSTTGGITIQTAKGSDAGWPSMNYPLPASGFTRIVAKFRVTETDQAKTQITINGGSGGDDHLEVPAEDNSIKTMETAFKSNGQLNMMILGGMLGNAKVEILEIRLIP